MGGNGLVGRTAVEIAAAVQKGEVTPLEVEEGHLARIAALDGRVNAFRVGRAEEVRGEATALGGRADLGELPLAGVPVAVKDNIDLAGCATANGSAGTLGELAAADSGLVGRLRAAGAMLIGKTSVPELCIWPFTESTAFGATRNPWNLEYTPGGSTGGGGAAVAAGMAPLALGADGGGSIRIPSSCCGLFGIKPGEGVVARPPELGSNWLGMSSFGPIATTVADAALLLDVLAGGDGYRRATPVSVSERTLRIGMAVKPPAIGVPLHPEVRAALEVAAEALREAGHTVTEAKPPWRQQDALPFLARFVAGVAEDSAGLPTDKLEPRTRAAARRGRLLGRVRPVPDAVPAKLLARYEAWFRDYDLLLTPTLATPPLRVGDLQGKGLTPTLLGVTRFIPFTPPLNLVRFPAASVPAGRSSDGLPIGVQLAAAPGGEGLLLAVAAQLERLRPWPRHAPLEPHPAP